MKLFNKRSTAVTVAALLSVSLLAGCGSSDSDDTAASSDSSADTTEQTEATNVTYTLFDPDYTDSDLD
ncbi:MAG: hypothetical protein ACRDBM_00295, partial [Sporomusa sp.]